MLIPVPIAASGRSRNSPSSAMRVRCARPRTIQQPWTSGSTTSICATIQRPLRRIRPITPAAAAPGWWWRATPRPTRSSVPSRRGTGPASGRAGAHDRLPSRQGRLIDRDTTLHFTFDGKPFTGHAGDTLASALIANGVHLMGRSFKYHRPRGAVTAGAAEPNALVELREGGRKEANTRATVIELYDGSSRRARTGGPRSTSMWAPSIRWPPPSSSPASTTRPSCGRSASGRRSTSR